MKPIGEALEKHTLVILNEALKKGFAQLPYYVLEDGKLSFGARCTYAILLKYAWKEDSCFPGQDRIAKDLSCSLSQVKRYLQQLKERKYVSWKQRGLGKTNVYYILDYKPIEIKSEPDSS